MIHVGMSGFSYPEWIGEIYPAGTKRKEMLTAYAEIFSAVEINMTFRRTPLEKTIDTWREAVPEAFRFTMKVHQRVTHWKKLIDVGEDVAIFVKAAQRMGDRLGPLLFQTPPKLAFDPVSFDAFGASLVPGVTYAFEPRHETFTAADDAFRRHGIARCLNDDVFDPKTYTTTAPLAYFRFHRANYSGDELAERAEIVRAVAADGIDVYAFFQHEDDPGSVRPALRFRELVA